MPYSVRFPQDEQGDRLMQAGSPNLEIFRRCVGIFRGCVGQNRDGWTLWKMAPKLYDGHLAPTTYGTYAGLTLSEIGFIFL